MEFVGIIPASLSYPEIRNYACRSCRKVIAIPPDEKLRPASSGRGRSRAPHDRK